MFESTLEAQALDDGPRKLGTLSAAALAHVAIGLAILAGTAIIVPPVRTPEVPPIVLTIAPRIPLDELAPRPVRPPAPKKGADVEDPARSIVPRHHLPETLPLAPPDLPPVVTTENSFPDQDRTGEGTPGQPDGSSSGVPGGLGDGDAGAGGGRGTDPLYLTGDMVRPVVLVKVDPAYPEAARRAGLGGRVRLQAVIAEDGSVESVEVFASTNPLFDRAAVEAVRKWRYRPALMNGSPVRVYFSVIVSFLVR